MMSHIRSRTFDIGRDVFHIFSYLSSSIYGLICGMSHMSVLILKHIYQYKQGISYQIIPNLGSVDGSGWVPATAQVMPFAMKSILVGGPKAGGVGEGLELRLPARVAQKVTTTTTTTTSTTSTTTARPTRHHQVEKLHGFSRGFLYNLLFVTITGRTQGIILPTSKSLAKVLLPKVQVVV